SGASQRAAIPLSSICKATPTSLPLPPPPWPQSRTSPSTFSSAHWCSRNFFVKIYDTEDRHCDDSIFTISPPEKSTAARYRHTTYTLLEQKWRFYWALGE